MGGGKRYRRVYGHVVMFVTSIAVTGALPGVRAYDSQIHMFDVGHITRDWKAIRLGAQNLPPSFLHTGIIRTEI